MEEIGRSNTSSSETRREGAPDTPRVLIVLVERDPHARRLERFFLEDAGSQVEFAETGQEGLARAREARPTIVIAEILLKGLDGLAVCRALKSERETRDIAVILFSSLEREAGADAFLKKPVEDRLLTRTVADLVSRRASR